VDRCESGLTLDSYDFVKCPYDRVDLFRIIEGSWTESHSTRGRRAQVNVDQWRAMKTAPCGDMEIAIEYVR
jgi:hypothetical protein